MITKEAPLIDKFGREVSYVRISVTDRCDFRCVYCMDEEMTFVPRTDVLSLEEIELLSEVFVELGVSKIRLTGGEPLVRSNVLSLCESLGKLEGLNELLKQPKDIQKAVENLLNERSDLLKKVEAYQAEAEKQMVIDLKSKVDVVSGLSTIIEKVTVGSADSLKQIAFELRKDTKDLFMVLAADVSGKPQVAVMISDDVVADRKLNAGQLVRELAKEIKGGGGGQPFFAVAGGKDISGLDNVITKAKEIVAGVEA